MMNRFIYLIWGCLFLPALCQGQHLPLMHGMQSYHQLADHYYAQTAYVKAAENYEKALEKSPEDTRLVLKLARCHTRLNAPGKAVKYFEQAMPGGHATGQDSLHYAEALHSHGAFEKAANWYEAYRTKYPDDQRVARKLAGLRNIAAFYEDSAAYRVVKAPFNTEKADFAPAWRQGELLFVSNRDHRGAFRLRDGRDGNEFLRLYQWKNGQTVRYPVTAKRLHEGPVTFFEAGNKAIVTVNHQPRKLKVAEADGLKLVIYEKKGEKWEYHSDFPYNDRHYSVGHPAFDETRQVLYFASNMPGGKGGVDLYVSEYAEGKWSAPQNLEAVNTEGDETFPFLHASTQDLYFASNGRGGLGGLDIYRTNINDPAGTVHNPGYPVNSSKDDFGLILDETGKRGYLSSNRDGGVGSDNIFEVAFFETGVALVVTDKTTGETLDATVKVIDSRTGEYVPHQMTGQSAMFGARRGRPYTLVVEKPGYEETKQDFIPQAKEGAETVTIPINREVITKEEPATIVHLANLSGSHTYRITTAALEPVEESGPPAATPVRHIENVYFAFDSDVILSGEEELTKLAELLTGYPSLDLKVIAYSDSFGPMAYNDLLSEKRINKVINMLNQQGVNPERIKTTLLGKRRLLNPCKDPLNCSKHTHRLDRRVEFLLFQGKG